MNWPSSLGPMPEEVREFFDYTEGWESTTAVTKARAAIAALTKQLAKSIEWGRIEQKRKQEAEEREHDAIVRAERAEAVHQTFVDNAFYWRERATDAEAARFDLLAKLSHAEEEADTYKAACQQAETRAKVLEEELGAFKDAIAHYAAEHGDANFRAHMASVSKHARWERAAE